MADGIDELRGIDRGIHRLAQAVESAAHSLELIAQSLASVDETLTAMWERARSEGECSHGIPANESCSKCRLADTHEVM